MSSITLSCAFLLIIAVGDSLAGKCTSTSDCDCGYVCVGRARTLPCMEGENCKCRKGCGVANLFIKNGRSVSNAYCNVCNCPRNSLNTQSTTACTRKAWCDLPTDVPLYPENPNCNTVE